MNVYRVDPEALVAAFDVVALTAVAEPVVGQLVERFDLAGKTLLSIGAGTAWEEAAFLRRGLREAVLVDAERALEPTLRRLDRPGAPLCYVVGDFLRSPPPREALGPIDVLYFSGFTPDELRRGEVTERHRRAAAPRRWWARRDDPDWPAAESPLHDAVLGAIDRYLRDGGLLIVQSYCAGVDVLHNPGYVARWRDVLRRHRVTLLETYYVRAAPGVTLWIGAKPPIPAALVDLAHRPPLTRFHARAQLEDCSIARLDAGGARSGILRRR
jgi:hypothetical protein